MQQQDFSVITLRRKGGRIGIAGQGKRRSGSSRITGWQGSLCFTCMSLGIFARLDQVSTAHMLRRCADWQLD
jgi:hypothetical protein